MGPACALEDEVGVSRTTHYANIQQLRKRLEAARDETLRFLHRAEHEAQTDKVNYVQDIGDLSITDGSREFLFQRASQKRQLLQMIEATLSRIKDGSFGECIVCGDEIESKRLEAMPWTEHCLHCRQELERTEPAPRERKRSRLPYASRLGRRS